MELGEYILSSVEDILRDARSETARRLGRHEALQFVRELNSKYTPEQRHQILQVLLKADGGLVEAYPPEIRTQADALLGWLDAMRSTVSGKSPAPSACAALLPLRFRDAAAMLCFASAIAGGVGWALDVRWLFWAGVALAVISLLVNIAARVLRALVIPGVLAVVGAFLLSPWYVGVAVGLLVGNAAEAAEELIRRARVKARR